MLCENCGKRPASYHFTSNINGKVTEKHLCMQCAAAEKYGAAENAFNDLLGGFFFGGRPASGRGVCPECGMTVGELSRTGKVGCAACYRAFADELAPMLRRLYGGAHHTGKIPATAAEDVRRKARLADAKKELSAAIEAQEFEQAARLRDEIRALEAEQ